MTASTVIWDETAPLPTGHFVLEASAGTGKTYAVTGLVARWLVGDGTTAPLRPDDLLVTTFTRAAALELRGRIRERLRTIASVATQPTPDATSSAANDATAHWLLDKLGPEELANRTRAVLANIDRATITTLHGFASQALAVAGIADFDHRAPVTEELGAVTRTAYDDVLFDVGANLAMTPGGYLALPTDKQLAPYAHLRLQHPRAPWGLSLDDPLRMSTKVAQACAAWESLGTQALEHLDQLGDVVLDNGKTCTTNDMKNLRLFAAELASGTYSSSRSTAFKAVRKLLDGGTIDGPIRAWLVAVDELRAGWSTFATRLTAHLADRTAARVASDLAERGERTHGDALRILHSIVAGPRSAEADSARDRLRHQWRVAIVDEFQDTDSEQWEILDGIFADRPLVLVGDPKQSIYRFRGADIDAYVGARDAASSHATMTRNWRSSAPLVDGVVQLFARRDLPFGRADVVMPIVGAARTNTGTERPQLRIATEATLADAVDRGTIPPGLGEPANDDWERIFAADVAADIATHLHHDDRPTGAEQLEPSDCAVLVSTHAEARSIKRALAAHGIASTHIDKQSVFATTEAAEMIILAEAMVHPARRREALATSLVGMPAPMLLTTPDIELGELEGLMGQSWMASATATRIRQVLQALHRHPACPHTPNIETTATTDQLLALLAAAPDVSLAAVPTWIRTHMQQAQERPEDTPPSHRIRPPATLDAVDVITVHGAKGLEWEATWVPFLWRHRLAKAPSYVRDGDAQVLYTRGSHNALKESLEAASFHESLRLAYVALTRARRHLVVYDTGVRSAQNRTLGPLAYLLYGIRKSAELPDDGAAGIAAAHEALEDTPWDIVEVDATIAGPQIASPERALGVQPLARPVPHRPGRRWSFSSIARHVHPYEEHAPVLAAEDPRTSADDAGLLDTLTRPSHTRQTPAAMSPWDAIRGGSDLGTAVHELLEHLDFTDPAALAPACADAASRLAMARGLDADATRSLASALTSGLERAMATPWAAAETPDSPPLLALRDIAVNDRLDELTFDMALPRVRLGIDTSVPTVRDLGALLAESSSAPDPSASNRVGERLMRRGTDLDLAGMLTGAIDLTVRTRRIDGEPVWWVVDYKTNQVAGRPLADVIAESDYALQYHLYMLALHRHLRTRLANYDPQVHIGGAIYLFLREMDATPGRGVWFEQTSPGLLDAMDTLLDGGRP